MNTSPSAFERGLAITLGALPIMVVVAAIIAFPLFQIVYIAGIMVLALDAVLVMAAWRYGLRWMATARALQLYAWTLGMVGMGVALFFAEDQRSVWLTGLAIVMMVLVAVLGIKRGWRWPFSRRVMRFAFWLLVASVSVIVLFYAEENWRGKRAWAALKREAEARSESLEMASLNLPAIPDDQNFVAAPGVTRVLGLDSTNLLPRTAFSLPQLEGIPHPSWVAGEFTDFARWTKYFEDAATNEAPAVPGPALTGADSAAAQVLVALRRYESDLEILRVASERPRARFPGDYRRGWWAGGTAMFNGYRTFWDAGKILTLRASVELELGKTDAALADVLLVFRLADVLRDQPRVNVNRVDEVFGGLQPVWEGIARRRWNAAQLAVLEECFSTRETLSNWSRRMRGEAMMYMHIADEGLAFAEGRDSQFERSAQSQNLKTKEHLAFWLVQNAYPRGWFYQDKVRIHRFQKAYVDSVRDGIWHAPLVNRNRFALGSTDPVFVVLILPPLAEMCEQARTLAFFYRVSFEQARVACALERYRLAQGNYPDSLASLVPLYLKEIPRDLMSPNEAPLRYVKGESGFMVYSVGVNGVDDGGRPVSAQKEWNRSDQNHDWVFKVP